MSPSQNVNDSFTNDAFASLEKHYGPRKHILRTDEHMLETIAHLRELWLSLPPNPPPTEA